MPEGLTGVAESCIVEGGLRAGVFGGGDVEGFEGGELFGVKG